MPVEEKYIYFFDCPSCKTKCKITVCKTAAQQIKILCPKCNNKWIETLPRDINAKKTVEASYTDYHADLEHGKFPFNLCNEWTEKGYEKEVWKTFKSTDIESNRILFLYYYNGERNSYLDEYSIGLNKQHELYDIFNYLIKAKYKRRTWNNYKIKVYKGFFESIILYEMDPDFPEDIIEAHTLMYIGDHRDDINTLSKVIQRDEDFQPFVYTFDECINKLDEWDIDLRYKYTDDIRLAKQILYRDASKCQYIGFSSWNGMIFEFENILNGDYITGNSLSDFLYI